MSVVGFTDDDQSVCLRLLSGQFPTQSQHLNGSQRHAPGRGLRRQGSLSTQRQHLKRIKQLATTTHHPESFPPLVS